MLVLAFVAAVVAGSVPATAERPELLGPVVSADRPVTHPTPPPWVTAWSAAPSAGWPIEDNLSVRNVVRLSAGGTAVRVRLSNRFGRAPLRVPHVTVARAVGGTAEAKRGTLHRVRFDGRRAVTIPAGEGVISDPVRLRTPDQSDLLVTMYVPEAPGGATVHPGGAQFAYLTSGDHAADTSAGAYVEGTNYRYWLAGVDVRGGAAKQTVVAFGDSITDGLGSEAGSNNRYPDYLAERLDAQGRELAVANAGIGGNRLLTSAPGPTSRIGPKGLDRFDVDALELAGVRTVIVLEGVNDLRSPDPPTAKELIDGFDTLVEQGRAAGVRVVCGTILPFKGSGEWTPEREQVRQRVNARIRRGLCDGTVDFGAALRSEADPARMDPVHDSGDGLHPGDEGYEAMAEAVDLRQL